MRTPLLANPAARGGRLRRALPRLAELAAAEGLEVVVPDDRDDLTARCREAAAAGLERVVVVGGDGTFHCAAQGLAGSGCALGMVPFGTGNDLASSLGVPLDPARAVRLAATGAPRAIDLGVACGRPFAVYCGVGFDSEAAAWVARRKRKGRLVYVAATVRTLVHFQPPMLRVEHDGGVLEGPAMFAVAANGPRFGGGMRIAPDARLDDGALDLVFVRRVSRLTLLRIFPSVFRGGHVGHPAIEIVRTQRARITIDRTAEPALDGEVGILSTRTIDLEVRPAALRVIAG